MRIMMLGDVHGINHGGTGWMQYVMKQAKLKGIDEVIQVGDFGYYPDKNYGQDFLYYANEACELAGIRCSTIGGNHENWERLLELNDRDDDGFMRMPALPMLRYIPRGHTWEWGGLRFLGFGGAFSIDKEDQLLKGTYHYREQFSYAEIEKAMSAGKVDVMVSHEAPAGTKWDRPFMEKYDAICQNNRNAIRAIATEVRPQVLFHGHYHHRYKMHLRLDNGWKMMVRGLHREWDYRSMFILQTQDVLVGSGGF